MLGRATGTLHSLPLSNVRVYQEVTGKAKPLCVGMGVHVCGVFNV